jgi:protease I
MVVVHKANDLRAVTFARWRGHEPEIAILAATTLILTLVAILAGADLLFTLLAAATAAVIIWSPWRDATTKSNSEYYPSKPPSREYEEAPAERYGRPRYREEVEAMQRRESTMHRQRLDDLHVAILVTDDFERVELTEPRKALDEAGAKTFIVAPHGGEVQSMDHDVKAERFKVDLTLDETNPDDFDAVLLPGGALNADILRMDKHAREFVRRIDQSDKPIAAICHAPWLLVSAGLIQGRTITSYYTLQDDIRNAGGRWLDTEVVHDRNWVSSRGPRDLPAFTREMVSLFSKSVRARRKAA